MPQPATPHDDRLDGIAEQYGTASPEYAAGVLENMLDARYERRAALDEQIEGLGAHLEREKEQIRRARIGRQVAAANARLDDDAEERRRAADYESWGR